MKITIKDKPKRKIESEEVGKALGAQRLTALDTYRFLKEGRVSVTELVNWSDKKLKEKKDV